MIIRAVFVAVSMLLVVAADGSSQDKKVQFKVTADELADAFKADADAAKKKYEAETKDGAKPVLQVIGELKDVKKKDLTLKTTGKIAVVLLVKNIDEKAVAGKRISGTGTFKEFKSNTVFIECQEVDLKLMGSLPWPWLIAQNGQPPR